MKVLFIDVNCKQNSTGKMVYELYSYLNDKGYEAAICYGRGDKVIGDNIYKFGLDFETCLHAFLTRITGFTGSFSVLSTYRLIYWIKKYKPDVVHIHELHAYFVNVKTILNFLSRNKIKTIFTMHCDFLYTGKCGVTYDCEKWKSSCGNCPRLKEYPSTMYFDHTGYMQKTKENSICKFNKINVVTPSKWLDQKVKQSFFNKYNTDFYIIYNGVDEKIFHPYCKKTTRDELGFSEKDIILLSAAPNLMSENKGGKWMLELAKKYLISNKYVKIIMIGVAGKNRCEENITYLNLISDQTLLAKYYSIADTFVLCSKSETFSMTCAEALMCGTPIAGFECGAPEIVFDKPYAEFVEYGNIELLYKAIQSQLSISRDDVVKYSKKFSVHRMAEQYVQLYKNMMLEDRG